MIAPDKSYIPSFQSSVKNKKALSNSSYASFDFETYYFNGKNLIYLAIFYLGPNITYNGSH